MTDHAVGKRRGLWLLVAVLMSAICMLACAGLVIISGASSLIYETFVSDTGPSIDKNAPDFELPTLTGGTVRLSQFRGHPLILSFATTWCPDCREEAPVLQDLHQRHPELVVLSVDSREMTETIKAFVLEHGLTFPIALDHDGKVISLYGVRAIPTLFFVDAEGVIQAQMTGTASESELRKRLASIGIEP